MAFSLTVLNIELFKLVLLFHLKDADPNVANFSGTMEKAPRPWGKLRQLVDSPLRNSLAHGTYAILPSKIVLFRNARMGLFKETNLGKFMMKAKSQDVLLQCLLDLLKKRGLFALDRV